MSTSQPKSMDTLCVFYSPDDKTTDQFARSRKGWIAEFEDWAEVKYRRGGETALAARLEGRQPVIIRVWADQKTDKITSAWRVDFDDRQWNIREHPQLSEDRLYYEFLAEAGVAI